MRFSFVPLLLGGTMLSPETRNALSEDRREDAAALLMRDYDLDCHEAGELVDVSVCDAEKTGQPLRPFAMRDGYFGVADRIKQE